MAHAMVKAPAVYFGGMPGTPHTNQKVHLHWHNVFPE